MALNPQLLIRVEIEALLSEFAFRIDHDLSDTVAELFTPDGWYGREDGRKSQGREAITAAYTNRSLRGERTVRHVFTNLRVTAQTEAYARGHCILLLFGGDGRPPLPADPILVQDYDDEYRLFEGRWLFASRRTRRLFVSPSFKPVLSLGDVTQ